MPKTPRFPPARRRIEILAYPDVQLLDIAGPLQVFSSAAEFAVAAGGTSPYEAVVVAAQPTVTASAGLGLIAHKLPPPDAPLDTLVVAGGWGVNAACG